MRIRRWMLCLMAIAGCGNAATIAGHSCAPSGGPYVCGAGTVCDPQSLLCVCAEGWALCGAACVPIAGDPGNCGACGLRCPFGQSCAGGRCSGGACPSGALDCSGTCIDPRSNAQSCGGCRGAGGVSCGDGQACEGGACTPLPCAFGATFCGNGCFDLASSALNCGACGRACPGGFACSLGACRPSCAPGLVACGAGCVDLRHDANNCGGCGNACGPGEVCASDGGDIKCRAYKFAGCNTCPCSSCGGRSCCAVANPAGAYDALCVADNCPLP